MLRTCASGVLFLVLLAGLVAFVPARGAPLRGPSAVEVAEVPARGCYLNFVARNEGSGSIFIDIANSRIRSFGPMYPAGTWAKIINTQSQNIHAGTRRTFTVWARLCGLAGLVHQVDFKLKRGADQVSVRAEHAGGDKTDNLGDLNRYF